MNWTVHNYVLLWNLPIAAKSPIRQCCFRAWSGLLLGYTDMSVFLHLCHIHVLKTSTLYCRKFNVNLKGRNTKIRNLALLAFLVQFKGCLCHSWTLGSLGRVLGDMRRCLPETCTALVEVALHGAVSKMCRGGKGRGCLRSTSPEGVPGTPNQRALSVF